MTIVSPPSRPQENGDDSAARHCDSVNESVSSLFSTRGLTGCRAFVLGWEWFFFFFRSSSFLIYSFLRIRIVGIKQAGVNCFDWSSWSRIFNREMSTIVTSIFIIFFFFYDEINYWYLRERLFNRYFKNTSIYFFKKIAKFFSCFCSRVRMISLFPFSFSFFLPIRIKYGVREWILWSFWGWEFLIVAGISMIDCNERDIFITFFL